MSYLSFISFVALSALGAYAGARWFFQDKAQGERFELLDREYSAMAKVLLEGNNNQEAKEIARKKDLIRLNLMQTVRLTETQASLLTAKIGHAALREMSP